MLNKLLIPSLALIFAYSGITYEYLLAYYITGLLGGGYAILFITFSFFAAFLGAGALAFNFIPQRFRNIFSLGTLQVALSLIVFFIPSFYELLNSLFINGQPKTLAVLSLSLLPACILGFATGFELPFLYFISRSRISNILFWDYVGMFGGIILFPHFLIQGYPYSTITYTLGGTGFLIGALLLLMAKSRQLNNDISSQEDPILNQTSPTLNPGQTSIKVGLLIAFLLSFCSFSYQGLIGKVIISILGDNHIVQSYAIGFYIIGMAFGSLIVDKFKFLKGDAAPLLIKVEASLCFIAALTPVALYFLGGVIFLFTGFMNGLSETKFLFGSSVAFSSLSLAVGILTGMELPLLFRWLKLNNEDSRSYWLITANYGAAIFAGLLVTFLLPKYLGHTLSFIPIVFINLVALLIILHQNKILNVKQKLGPLAFVLLAVVINVNWVLPSRQFFLNSYYAQFSLTNLSFESLRTTLKAIQAAGSTERIESFFQNIDLRTTEDGDIEGREKEFALFLNKQPQFNSTIFRNYHQSMSFAGRSFMNHAPKEILILGGGDGLLANEVLSVFPDSRIFLVELDPVMIDLALNNSRFTDLNRGALKNSRVQIEVGDAYNFVRTTKMQFDLIFVDFPYPTSIDLSRLYSLEFYKGLRRIMTNSGVAVIDAPILTQYEGATNKGQHPNVKKILSTMYFAGFQNPFCFGPFDPFVALSKDNRKLSFSTETLKNIPNPIFINLSSLHHNLNDLKFDKEDINQVLAPTILEM